MYLPRDLINLLYDHLNRTNHPMSPSVLILVALEPDALCACRILTSLFKRDYIGHKIHPVCGYNDLAQVGQLIVSRMKTQNGGVGGLVICLGVGGLVDVSSALGLEDYGDGQNPSGGVEVWVIDARRPWNLGNVFGGDPSISQHDPRGSMVARSSQVDKGRICPGFKPGQGGVIVWDDGDIDKDLKEEREAYCALLEMGDVDDDYESGESLLEEEQQNLFNSAEDDQRNGRKRKSWADREDESDVEDQRPRRRRRSRSVSLQNTSRRQH